MEKKKVRKFAQMVVLALEAFNETQNEHATMLSGHEAAIDYLMTSKQKELENSNEYEYMNHIVAMSDKVRELQSRIDDLTIEMTHDDNAMAGVQECFVAVTRLDCQVKALMEVIHAQNKQIDQLRNIITDIEVENNPIFKEAVKNCTQKKTTAKNPVGRPRGKR